MTEQGGRWPNSPRARCKAHRKSGRQCQAYPVKGTDVCTVHGGSAPQVRRRGAVVAELTDWGVNDEHVDPGEQLLRLIAQSARRAAYYGHLLERAHAGDLQPVYLVGKGVSALIGQKTLSKDDGTTIELGEFVRGLVELEERERDRCAKWCGMAVAAGLEARRVALEERTAAALERALIGALEAAGLGERLHELLPAIAERLDAA